jgi:hypothetical protein
MRRRRRFSGWFALIVVIAGMVVFSSAMELFWTRIDQHRFPWAYARSGRPTLTGTWVGALTTARGTRRGLYLELELEPLRFGRGRRNGAYRHAGSDKLIGELRMCGGSSGAQRFELHGNNVADDASRFRLSFRVPEGTTPSDGLAPSHLRGMWNGRDSLRIEADLYLRRGASAITDGADPETGAPQPGALHRAEPKEFSATCNRLASTR